MSGTIIRGTQLPIQREKSTKERRTKFSLARPPARHMSKPAHLPASSEASLRGVSEHLRFARGLSPGSRTHDDITASSEPQNRHYLSPPRPRLAFDAAPPLARSRPPVTSPTFLRLPNRTDQEWPGSNHHVIVRNKHGEELLTTMPPILALYARFVPT
jgi:hypothetical protein